MAGLQRLLGDSCTRPALTPKIASQPSTIRWVFFNHGRLVHLRTREGDVASGEYFRRQADVCLQLAQVSEERVASRLVEMAEDFFQKAKEQDAGPSIVPQGSGSVRSRASWGR